MIGDLPAARMLRRTLCSSARSMMSSSHTDHSASVIGGVLICSAIGAAPFVGMVHAVSREHAVHELANRDFLDRRCLSNGAEGQLAQTSHGFVKF